MLAQWVVTVAHCPDFPNVSNFLGELTVSLVGTQELHTFFNTVTLSYCRTELSERHNVTLSSSDTVTVYLCVSHRHIVTLFTVIL